MIERDRSRTPGPSRLLTSALAGAAAGTAVGLGAWWALDQLILAASGTGAPAGLALALASLGGSITALLLAYRLLMRRASESDLLRLVVESTAAGVWIVDREFDSVWLNDSMRRLLGEEPTSGSTVFDYFGEEDRRKLEEARQERRRGISSAYQATVRRPDGTERVVYIIGTPIYGPDGRHLGSFGFFMDITDQQKAAEEAAEEARVETLMATVARLNHKINNALMVIRGQAEVSIRKVEEEGPVHAFQRVIDQVDLITGELKSLSELREVQLEDYLGSRPILSVPEPGTTPEE
ncbi:MAG: PAS domain-containing protein [bacterium]